MKTARPKLKAIILAAFLMAACLPGLTYAEAIGKITAVEGNVDIMKPGQERVIPVRLLAPVSEGDIVRTKSSGKAEITFDDESIIRMAPNSRLQITEYLMEGSKRKSGVMNLFRGKIRAVVSKSRKIIGIAFGEGERFEVRTPTAVAGVKGTDFFVFHQMDITGVVVLEGRIDTFNVSMPEQVVMVATGYTTIITRDKPPQKPRPTNKVEKIRHMKDTDPAEESMLDILITTAMFTGGGEVFGYEAPEGIEPPPADIEPTPASDLLPSTETHTELLADTTVTVDTIAPTASITPVSASPYKAGTDLSTVNINLSSNETPTFSYSLTYPDMTSTSGTGSSLSLSPLAEGNYTLAVTATDTAGNPSSPASLSFDLSRYSLTGSVSAIDALVGGSITSGEVAGISNQNWGGWDIVMDGWSEGNPPPKFTLSAGGTSTDVTFTNGQNNGYWLEIINVTSDSVSSLSGTSSLTYLSYDRLGTGTGIMAGSYDGFGNWSATDSGTYTETPLAWSGQIPPGTTANNAGLYSFDQSYLYADGPSAGLMGGVASPWADSTAVTYMGTYTVGGGVGPPYIWTPEIYSYNANDLTNTTYDGGAYKGFVGGVWKGDGTIDAKVYSLYIDPSGKAGILKGGLNGAYYPGINMFEADGTWTPTSLTTGLNATTATYNVVSTDHGANIPFPGNFNGSGSITAGWVNFNGGGTTTDWRYSIAGQNWGIWKSIIGGEYTEPTSDTWSLSTFVDLSAQGTIYGTKTDGTKWSADVNGNNVLAGQTYGYGADITATPMTWISVGETIGTFDPVALTWQAVQTGAWLETKNFLAMTQTGAGQAALTALNIPFVEVGRANLTDQGKGTIGGMSATAAMNNVIFFAYQTGAAPKIWATGDIQGTYTCTTCYAGTIPVAGNGLSANVNVQTFDTGTGKWIATVDGSGTLSGGSYSGPTTFNGAAAGTIDTTSTFTGTAAGVAQ